ncbi:hypothetical protein C8F01DRAFT_1266609 [Mycena amicta]|nr:hypothetical protein C8F01DRAFT_1266609 [Mycena amicta]
MPIASERTDGTDGMTALTVATGASACFIFKTECVFFFPFESLSSPRPPDGPSQASQYSGRLQCVVVPRSASFEPIPLLRRLWIARAGVPMSTRDRDRLRLRPRRHESFAYPDTLRLALLHRAKAPALCASHSRTLWAQYVLPTGYDGQRTTEKQRMYQNLPIASSTHTHFSAGVYPPSLARHGSHPSSSTTSPQACRTHVRSVPISQCNLSSPSTHAHSSNLWLAHLYTAPCCQGLRRFAFLRDPRVVDVASVTRYKLTSNGNLNLELSDGKLLIVIDITGDGVQSRRSAYAPNPSLAFIGAVFSYTPFTPADVASTYLGLVWRAQIVIPGSLEVWLAGEQAQIAHVE